jgi:hypothetical protein
MEVKKIVASKKTPKMVKIVANVESWKNRQKVIAKN